MSSTRAMPHPRIARRAVHGVLVLDKDVGVTSNGALQRAKRLYRAEKAGHTGTLDPLASGVLPLCFGAATKFAQASLDADKRYLATLCFGTTTTTGDLEGEVVRSVPGTAIDRAALERVCSEFVGETLQVPPMHSALKHEGKPLYDYARAGVEVERTPRRVRIGALRVVEGARERWTIDVACSKGTYVRTLAEDIGAALGCGAHLTGLRRTASGALDLDAALAFDALEALDEAALDARLLPPDALVADRPAIALAGEDAARFLAGMRRRVERPDSAAVRVYGPDPGAFLGTGHIAGGELIASRLLSPPEVAALVARRRCSPAAESLFA